MSQTEYTSQIPKLTWNATIVVPGADTIVIQFCGEVDRRMDEIQQIVGNGQAKVTVGIDMSIKDYGTGASAFCSVSLTCNQDQNSIDQAAAIAGELARGYAQEQRERAEQELLAITRSRQGQGQSPRY